MAGAHYGYSLLWMMPLVALALIVVQEMSARLGVVTGKGLADLIRERLGVRWTAVIIGILVFANLTNTVSEFAGVAASMEIFGVSKYVAVPIAAAIVWLLIVKADYKFVEQVFLIASAIYLAYVASGILAQPSWGEVARFAVTPSFHLDVGYVTLFALGLLNASIFSAAILPLSTAYVVCEAFGWEAAVSRSFSEAPIFFSIYTALIIVGAAIILLPIKSLVQTMLASQTLNGVLLPVILIVMLRLINEKRLMGKFVNGRVFNILAWGMVVILIGLTAVLVTTSLFPGMME